MDGQGVVCLVGRDGDGCGTVVGRRYRDGRPTVDGVDERNAAGQLRGERDRLWLAERGAAVRVGDRRRVVLYHRVVVGYWPHVLGAVDTGHLKLEGPGLP